MNIDGVEPKEQNVVKVPNHQEYGLVLLCELYKLNKQGFCVSKGTLDKIKIYLKEIGKIL